MTVPELWIVAGPNGAGKTTCVLGRPIAAILPSVRFLNPDDVTKQLLLVQGLTFQTASPDIQLTTFSEAAEAVEADLLASVGRGESIGIETVLSTGKYRRVVEDVHRTGGKVNLIYITVESPAIAVARVAMRFARGGHGVPPHKVSDRYYRSHLNLNWFATNADRFWVIDNSGSDPTVPPTMPAHGAAGVLEYLDPNASDILKCVLSTLKR